MRGFASVAAHSRWSPLAGSACPLVGAKVAMRLLRIRGGADMHGSRGGSQACHLFGHGRYCDCIFEMELGDGARKVAVSVAPGTGGGCRQHQPSAAPEVLLRGPLHFARLAGLPLAIVRGRRLGSKVKLCVCVCIFRIS